MLRYQPQFRYPERAAKPSNLFEAMNIAPGVMYANGEPEDLALDVVTPSGETLAVDDPVLTKMLGEGIGEKNELSLVRSDRSMTDCRPISLIGVQSVAQIEAEMSVTIDKRRFRANIYLNHSADGGFAENELVGRRVRIGSQAEIMILERDPRCKVISLDPETGEHNPAVLKQVAKAHSAFAGVYCAVLVEGILTKGDSIEVLD